MSEIIVALEGPQTLVEIIGACETAVEIIHAAQEQSMILQFVVGERGLPGVDGTIPSPIDCGEFL